MISMEELLTVLVQRGGSDLHMSVGSPPRIRVDGRLIETEFDALNAETAQKVIYSILTPDQIARFEETCELDCSFGFAGFGRFRTNVFLQRGTVGAVLRIIPFEVYEFDQLGLPRRICEDICRLPKGQAASRRRWRR